MSARWKDRAGNIHHEDRRRRDVGGANRVQQIYNFHWHLIFRHSNYPEHAIILLEICWHPYISYTESGVIRETKCYIFYYYVTQSARVYYERQKKKKRKEI